MNNASSQTALLGIGGIMGFHLRLLTAKLLGRNWPSIAPSLQVSPWRQDGLSWVLSEAPGKQSRESLQRERGTRATGLNLTVEYVYFQRSHKLAAMPPMRLLKRLIAESLHVETMHAPPQSNIHSLS